MLGITIDYVVIAMDADCLIKLDGTLNADQARQALSALRRHVSADQHAAALLMLSGGVSP